MHEGLIIRKRKFSGKAILSLAWWCQTQPTCTWECFRSGHPWGTLSCLSLHSSPSWCCSLLCGTVRWCRASSGSLPCSPVAGHAGGRTTWSSGGREDSCRHSTMSSSRDVDWTQCSSYQCVFCWCWSTGHDEGIFQRSSLQRVNCYMPHFLDSLCVNSS